MRTSCLFVTVLAAVLHAGEARYEQYTAQAAKDFSASIQTLTAGRLGWAGAERAVGAAFTADGRPLVAIAQRGPGDPKARVLGPDAPALSEPDSKGDVKIASLLDPGLKAVGGAIIVLKPDGSGVAASIRLGRATGSCSALAVSGDTVIVAGCGDRAALAALGKAKDLPPSGTPGTGERWPDIFVLGLSADLATVRWLRIGTGSQPPALSSWKDGAILDAGGDLIRIAADGSSAESIPVKGASRTRWIATSLLGDRIAAFGDVNTRTNVEPYRNPYLTLHDAAGKQLDRWWSFDPKLLGGDTKITLQSDSSPRAVAWSKTGTMLVGAWSDGGNSVFLGHPKELGSRHEAFAKGFIDSVWGMGVGGCGYLMRIDPKTAQVKQGTYWISFVPNDPETFTKKREIGKPNTMGIHDLCELDDGTTVVLATSATGLIETPDAWWRYPGKGKMGGETVAVFSPDLSRLRFSTWLPTVTDTVIAKGPGGRVLIAGASAAKEPRRDDATVPSVRPLQPGFGGGASDAFISLIAPRQ